MYYNNIIYPNVYYNSVRHNNVFKFNGNIPTHRICVRYTYKSRQYYYRSYAQKKTTPVENNINQT